METATTTATGAGTDTTGAGFAADASRHPLPVLVSRIRARLGDELPPVLWSMPADELVDLLVDLQTVRIADDGKPEFIPPDWIDPHRNPIRNNRLRT
ncbi:MAG: hypothetical protein ACRDP8_09940 [Actinopolymorphaceae bacterium]